MSSSYGVFQCSPECSLQSNLLKPSTPQIKQRTQRKTLLEPKDPNKDVPRKRSRTGKTQSAASTSSEQDSREEESIKVKHETKCYSCYVLSSFNDGQLGQLQHRYKFCYTYSIFFRIIMVLKTIIFSNKYWHKSVKIETERIRNTNNVFDPENAKRICQWAASNLSISTYTTELFTRAAALSGELIGPTETAKFNCDNYKDYLELLLEISQLIKADKVLIEDIELYLKPFRQNPANIAVEDRARKWDETFVDLRHSPGDSTLGYQLQVIIPSKNNKKHGYETDEEEETISFIPSNYNFECHGHTKISATLT